MNLTPEELQTLDAYNTNTINWASSHDDDDFWEEELKEFKRLLPTGKILEIGVGAGRDSKYFIKDQNYEFLGTDISEELLKVAKTNNPTGEFKLSSIYELGDLNQKFDGFWCAAVLLHIPRDRLKEALDSINNVLNDGAIGFISTKLGTGEGMQPYSLDKSKSRLVVYYEKDELINRLNDSGFEIVWESLIEERHNKWQSFIIRKIS